MSSTTWCPITAHTAVGTFPPFLWKVGDVLEPFQSLSWLWSSSSLLVSLAAERCWQRIDQCLAESLVCHRSLSSWHCYLLVNNVWVHDSDLKHPKEHLSPPIDALVKKAVVAGKLIQLVNTKHVLIVVIDDYWLQLHLSGSTWYICVCVCVCGGGRVRVCEGESARVRIHIHVHACACVSAHMYVRVCSVVLVCTIMIPDNYKWYYMYLYLPRSH